MRKKTASPKRRNGKSFYHKGNYIIKNVDKYMGNPVNCIYESMWEFHFMAYLDMNDSVRRWGNEIVVIPYIDEKGRHHRYYTDFYFERVYKNDPNNFERYVVEIKPKKEVLPDFLNEYGKAMRPEEYIKGKITPKKLESYEYKLKTYNKNLYKWDKAKRWCEAHKMKFVIIHEDVLKSKKIMA